MMVYNYGIKIVAIIIYIDDILVTSSNSNFVQDIIVKLNVEFTLKDLYELNYFLGIEVIKSKGYFHLNQ